MGYDEGGWKRKVVNGVIFLVGAPFYVIKKMLDYRDAFDEEQQDNSTT